MSVWNQVRNILLTGICATSFLWPYEAEADRAYDNRRISRQRKREQKRAQKRARRNNKSNRNRPSGRLNSENPRRTFDALMTSVQASKELSSEHKKLITTCLTELSQSRPDVIFSATFPTI